jgi:hypothetical protein
VTRLGIALLAAVALAACAAQPARAHPRCFGAADRDPARPCANPRLRLLVRPTPDEAALIPNVGCVRETVGELLDQCTFGAPAGRAAETVALIGDSHAAHWRAALAYVAGRRGWRVVEITRPHCPLSFGLQFAGGPLGAQCPVWNRAVVSWFAGHPEIRTVFISGNARAPLVSRPGMSDYTARLDGYLSAWRALPPSITRLVVIRDSPTRRTATPACVRRAIRRRRPAGRYCEVAREMVLPRDPALEAARMLQARGAQVADFTRQFCGRRWCFPVVGGVLVHKDFDHLTQLFASTLGPLLLRRLDALPAPERSS